MGITIHYKGRIKKRSEIDHLADVLEDFAKILDWKTQRYPLSEPSETEDDEAIFGIQQHQPGASLHGIVLYPHESCEPFSFTFDRQGWLVDYRVAGISQESGQQPGWLHVKTHFAPSECHIAMVRLLKYLKKSFIPDLDVRDEGGYWDSGDPSQLENRLETLNHAMDSLVDGFTVIPKEAFRNRSAEEIADLIEKLLKRHRE